MVICENMIVGKVNLGDVVIEKIYACDRGCKL